MSVADSALPVPIPLVAVTPAARERRLTLLRRERNHLTGRLLESRGRSAGHRRRLIESIDALNREIVAVKRQAVMS